MWRERCWRRRPVERRSTRVLQGSRDSVTSKRPVAGDTERATDPLAPPLRTPPESPGMEDGMNSSKEIYTPESECGNKWVTLEENVEMEQRGKKRSGTVETVGLAEM
ncbi:unnamed protein product [Pleuronectes platessa]|uniref:Uncharacterized protein n=1 Tax=Pleuronectes platessa TaxID=8262 RepID=A0A9N7VV26_PLEPL|nr:unnamed protein product [Pleuronectes platessa]